MPRRRNPTSFWRIAIPSCTIFPLRACAFSPCTDPPEKARGEDGLPIPPYAIYNIGSGAPESLLDYAGILQEELVRSGVLPADYDFEGHRELTGMQPGDIPVTYADSADLERDYGFKPAIGIQEGLRRFARWYKEYYGT